MGRLGTPTILIGSSVTTGIYGYTMDTVLFYPNFVKNKLKIIMHEMHDIISFFNEDRKKISSFFDNFNFYGA
jgi:hypothetical protein